MGARVYVAGARVHVRSYWWEPESMLGVMGGARVYASLVILVSAQVPLVLTLGLWTLGLWTLGLRTWA